MSCKKTILNLTLDCDFLFRGCEDLNQRFSSDIHEFSKRNNDSISNTTLKNNRLEEHGNTELIQTQIQNNENRPSLGRDRNFIKELLSGEKRLKDYTQCTLYQKQNTVRSLDLATLISIRLKNKVSKGLEKVQGFASEIDNCIAIQVVDLCLQRTFEENKYQQTAFSLGPLLAYLFRGSDTIASSKREQQNDLKKRLGRMILQTLGLMIYLDEQHLVRQKKNMLSRQGNQESRGTTEIDFENINKSILPYHWWKLTLNVDKDFDEVLRENESVLTRQLAPSLKESNNLVNGSKSLFVPPLPMTSLPGRCSGASSMRTLPTEEQMRKTNQTECRGRMSRSSVGDTKSLIMYRCASFFGPRRNDGQIQQNPQSRCRSLSVDFGQRAIPVDLFLNIKQLVIKNNRPNDHPLYICRTPSSNASHSQSYEIWEIDPKASLEHFLGIDAKRTAFQEELVQALENRRSRADSVDEHEAVEMAAFLRKNGVRRVSADDSKESLAKKGGSKESSILDETQAVCSKEIQSGQLKNSKSNNNFNAKLKESLDKKPIPEEKHNEDANSELERQSNSKTQQGFMITSTASNIKNSDDTPSTFYSSISTTSSSMLLKASSEENIDERRKSKYNIEDVKDNPELALHQQNSIQGSSHLQAPIPKVTNSENESSSEMIPQYNALFQETAEVVEKAATEKILTKKILNAEEAMKITEKQSPQYTHPYISECLKTPIDHMEVEGGHLQQVRSHSSSTKRTEFSLKHITKPEGIHENEKRNLGLSQHVSEPKSEMNVHRRASSLIREKISQLGLSVGCQLQEKGLHTKIGKLKTDDPIPRSTSKHSYQLPTLTSSGRIATRAVDRQLLKKVAQIPNNQAVSPSKDVVKELPSRGVSQKELISVVSNTDHNQDIHQADEVLKYPQSKYNKKSAGKNSFLNSGQAKSIDTAQQRSGPDPILDMFTSTTEERERAVLKTVPRLYTKRMSTSLSNARLLGSRIPSLPRATCVEMDIEKNSKSSRLQCSSGHLNALGSPNPISLNRKLNSLQLASQKKFQIEPDYLRKTAFRISPVRSSFLKMAENKEPEKSERLPVPKSAKLSKTVFRHEKGFTVETRRDVSFPRRSVVYKNSVVLPEMETPVRGRGLPLKYDHQSCSHSNQANSEYITRKQLPVSQAATSQRRIFLSRLGTRDETARGRHSANTLDSEKQNIGQVTVRSVRHRVRDHVNVENHPLKEHEEAPGSLRNSPSRKAKESYSYKRSQKN